MVTICKAGGLRIVIFLDDHEPAHVHVFGDGHMKVNLANSNGLPELIYADNMKKGDIRQAMRLIQENREAFLTRWREIHG